MSSQESSSVSKPSGNNIRATGFKSKFGTLFKKLRRQSVIGAAPTSNDALDSPRHGVFLQTSEPQLVMKQNQMIELDHLRTMIIGYGLEVDGYDAQGGSKTKQQLVRNTHSNSHPTESYLLNSMLGKTFAFSIRGHAVMYDRWGFIVYSGCGMKDCNKDKLFEYERRRRFKSFMNIECVSSQINHFTVSMNEKPIGSDNVTGDHCSSFESRTHIMEDMKDESLVTSEVMFVQNDTCYDMEQIRIHINDPTEVHHILLLLDFEASQQNMLDKEYLSYLPHMKAYVRLIDARTGNEVVRYYMDELPKITVALELNRIETAEQRMMLDEVHRQRLEQELHVHIPTVSCMTKTKSNGSLSDSDSPGDISLNEGGDSPDTPRYLENTLEGNQQEPVNGVIGVETAEEVICETLYEKKIREIQMLSQVLQEDLSWDIVTLKDEWFFNPTETLVGDEYLASFLSQVDLNTLGTSAIPNILPAAFKVDIIKGRNLQGKKLYCLLSVNSRRHSQKLRTRATRKHIWEKTFKFLTEPGYRACTIVIDIWEMHHLGSDLHLGQVLIPFGMVTDSEDPVFEAEFPVCKVSSPRKGSVIGHLSCRVELLLLGL